MHGPKGSRRKQSEYSLALAEKQKLRLMYGLMERQFRGYYEKAAAKRGVTGVTMLQMLEMRLDNVVFRLGFGNTRRAARQMVGHGHVQVNGRKVDISSYQVKVNDVVAVREKPKSKQLGARGAELTQIVPVPDWMTVNRDNLSGQIARVPTREEIAPIVNEQLIVELYSR
jgi:small subunit ribosomal protein S4